MFARVYVLTALALTSLQRPAMANVEPRAKFVVVANHHSRAPHNATSSLKQWSGSVTDLTHKTITYVMVGTDPAKTNTSTTISVALIPVKMVYGTSNGNMTLDPNEKKLSNGNTIVQNTLASPLFKSGIEFDQGGVDLGKTQYIDAFQRGNFWSHVKTHTGYHVLLGTPTVLSEQTITVPSSDGK